VSAVAIPEAPKPQVRQVLLRSLGVSLVDFRCRAHVEPLGPEEPNPTHGIVLVRKGVFSRVHRGETLTADSNHVLFFNAGEPYRYAHPLPGGDDCTILAVQTRRALELVARHAPREAEREETPFPIGHGLSSPRAVQLQYELLGIVGRQGSGLEIEDTVASLADEAVGAAYRARGHRDPSASFGTPARRRQRDLVEAVKLALNERSVALPSLTALAAAFDCSPFHLSRVFHAVAGVGLRRYALRLRARWAADLLAAGARDLTQLALQLGYADHSHFTNSFRQEWGVPPSRFRAARR